MTIAASIKELRKAALALEGAEEGVACAGTALESITVKAKKKAFVFLRRDVARVKLDASLAAAAKLAKKDPAHYSVGAKGWVAIKYDEGHPVPVALLKKWIAESYRMIVG